MPIIPFIPMIASGIGGIFSGIGNSKSRTATGTQNQTSTTTQELDPAQQRLSQKLWNHIMDAIKLGPQVSDSDRNVARTQTNNTFDAANQNIMGNLSRLGYGESGKVGTAFRNNNIARANSFQNTEAVLRDQSQNRFQQMIQNAFQYMQPRSSTTTGSGTSSQTQPGTPWQSSAGGGLSDLSSLLYMMQMGGNPFGGGASGAGQSTTMSPPCLIAIELYGATDWRVALVRLWLTAKAKQSLRWRAFVKLYCVFGETIARTIRADSDLRNFFKRLFDGFVMQALQA